MLSSFDTLLPLALAAADFVDLAFFVAAFREDLAGVETFFFGAFFALALETALETDFFAEAFVGADFALALDFRRGVREVFPLGDFEGRPLAAMVFARGGKGKGARSR